MVEIDAPVEYGAVIGIDVGAGAVEVIFGSDALGREETSPDPIVGEISQLPPADVLTPVASGPS